MFKRTLIARLLAFLMPGIVEGEGGGAPEITPELQAVIDAKVADAVTGLKAKNSELLGKLRTSADDLKRFEGIDPDAVRSILSKFASEEEAALIAKGDIDAVLKKRTERMQTDHAKQLKDAQAESAKHIKAKQKLASRALASEIIKAAAAAGAEKTAYEDIVLRAQGVWSVNDDGDVAALNGDEVILGKDGKTPLTPIEWAESLRETAPHLWPRAQGTNAPGSSNARPSGSEIFKLSPVERMNAARAQRK